jgi:hypothetical protein
MTPDPTEDTTTFADLGLRPELLRALSGLGYEEPTPIQREAIPPLLQGRDLLGQAATGTGKTAAFALPVLERISRQAGRGEPMALVLVPTRELAMQVSEAIHRYGRELGARILPIYGGQPIGRQLRALERGVDVVVATPGRAIDHIARETLGLGSLEVVVLDEADEMLDMGFAEDIEAILRHAPEDRQTVLFSATMPPRINGMVRRHLHDPVRVQLGRAASGPGDGSLVRQSAYVVPRAHKAAALGRVLDVEAPAAALVFCRTRDQVEQLTETLNGRGYRAEALRARRLELTRAALRESLLEDDLERFRGAVEPLAEEFDVLQVALAAVKLAHEATGAAADADEIPEAAVGPDGEPHRRRAVAGGDRRHGRVAADGSTRLFIGAGRSAGVRPQDLVGAIAGESRLSGRDIGAIEITDRYSLVEVPESAADEVIAALRASTIKGRKPTIRRERYQPR